MATSLYKAQIPFRVKGQTTCINHKGRQIDHYCEECLQLACTTCLSTVHNGHPLCRLDKITPKKKEDIQNYIDKTEKADLVHIDQYITVTEGHLKDNASNFEKLSNQLKTQTNKLKDELDLLTAKTLSLYQQMEDDNTKLLQTYKQDLEMYSTQLKQQVQECKLALQRGTDIQVYDTGCEIQSTDTIPVKPTLGTASFSPNRNPQGHLEQALGKVNISGQGHGQALRKDVSSPVDTLLPQTKVLGVWTFASPCGITSVCPTTDGQVWTSHHDSDILTLLDRQGTIIQEATNNTDIRDISLSPTTNTLWICDEKNNITEFVSGRLVHRFSTRETPQCICITASNCVIVGMVKHISKFTTIGELVCTSSATGTGKPLVCTPYRIAECPVTHNVAVADCDSKHHGGEEKPHVVVMDTNCKELFVFGGEVPHTYQPTSQSGGEPFYPCGVLYDSVGNLVIVDYGNKRILLISGRGEFLRILHTDNNIPWAVGVDREDVLWAVFGGIVVKLLQYSSV